MHRGASVFSLGLRVALSLGLLLAIPLAAMADVLHFYDGKALRGKVNRMTGDIIEFKPDFDQLENVRRLTLSNRHDVVEMRNGQKLFGEIIYVDKFRLELQTSTGRTKISRFRIRNLVLGAPEQPALNGFTGGNAIPLTPPKSTGIFPKDSNITPLDTGFPPTEAGFSPPPPEVTPVLAPAAGSPTLPDFSVPVEDRDAIPTDRVP